MNAKLARNNEIKRLWAGGKWTQERLAKRYKLTQCRISAIILDRLPKYRYCRHCKARSSFGNLCDTHRKLGREKRLARRRALVAMKEQKRIDRQKALRLRAEKKEREAAERKTRRSTFKEVNCFGCFRMFLKANTPDNPQGNKDYCHACSSLLLQVQGRERTRELRRIRDNHTCQNPECAKVWEPGQRRFDIHHLNGICGKRSRSYDAVSELDGLITLCHDCHFKRDDHSSNVRRLQTVGN